MTAELEANKAQRKCVAFLPVEVKPRPTSITGQSKAQGGYELLRYYHTKSLYRHSVVISRAISAAPTRGRDRRSSRI